MKGRSLTGVLADAATEVYGVEELIGGEMLDGKSRPLRRDAGPSE